MRFNLRWLREYLDTSLPYNQLLEAITMAGHEVEEALDLGAGSGGVVLGEILSIDRHPDADKLHVCRVKANAEEPLQIVCGAHNIEVGQRVPVALIGTTLPNGVTLKPAKIRGVESQGMMCSAKELHVADDHSGIWIQDNTLPVGESFDALVGIKVTPNRPDVLSLVGLARDLAAKTGGKLRTPEVKFPESGERVESFAKVVVEAKEDCPRYAARVIRNVKIGPSPLWLQRKLEAAGLRPRNNVVDVTNYVMLELGHPLHAFDLDRVAGKTIVVRLAREGEVIGLLDDSEVQLQPNDLLICDGEKPVALAGIMGGGNSEISDATVNVLLEAAYFRPTTIRRTAKRIDKSTDASYRFERGADPKRLLVALHRAAQLIAELAGGDVAKGHIDALAKIPEAEPITLRLDRLRTLSGIESLTGRQAGDILTKLGFEILRVEPDELAVVAPSWRGDIDGPADLVEEIVRIHGYEKVIAKLPPMTAEAAAISPDMRLEERLSDELVALGLSQAINFSFVPDGANAAAGIPDDARSVRLANPLSADQAVMRRSMVPSLLQNLVHNQSRGVEAARLFEIGRTYEWPSDEAPENEDPRTLTPPANERRVLAIALGGSFKSDWRTPARDYDFFDIKGIAERLVEVLGATRVVLEPARDVAFLHPGRAAAFLKGGRRLCWFGELHPAIAKELDLRKRVYLLECPLDGLAAEAGAEATFRALPQLPPAKRDLALVVKRDVASQDLERTLRAAGRELLSSVRLFDLYEGKGLGEDERSLAFAFAFRDPKDERALRDDEVNACIEKMVKAATEKHGARLR